MKKYLVIDIESKLVVGIKEFATEEVKAVEESGFRLILVDNGGIING